MRPRGRIVAGAVVALAGGAAACTDAPALPADLPAIDGYRDWPTVMTHGPAPGHSGYRIIYVNDVARTYQGGQYPEGSILVKEVLDLEADDQPGALRYVAIMRRLGPAGAADDDEGGWLFTEADAPDADEVVDDGFCWSRCHVAAPYHGAWFDYAK